jgi:hypothetical protein
MKRIWLLYLIAILLLLGGVMTCTAQAQTGIPTSWELRIYNAGTNTLTVPAVTVAAPQVACNQPKPTVTGDNPTRWWWNDTQNTNMACIVSDATRLLALPDGTYDSAVLAKNADGPAATESAPRVPFVRRRPNPPAVTTGTALIP